MSFDTNVLVRVLTGDDPEQTARAEAAFVEHCEGAGVFVPTVVLAETAWVLSRAYGFSRALVHERIDSLVRTRGVMVEDTGAVVAALAAFEKGRAGFADYMILAAARNHGTVPLLTFDGGLRDENDVQLL